MSEGGERIPEVQEDDGIDEIDVTSTITDGGVEDDEEIQEAITPGQDESTESIVRRSYEALKKQNAGSEGANENQIPQTRGVKKAAAKNGADLLIPPQRLTGEQKELFGQMPAPLQKAVHEMFRHHEGMATRATQEARAAQQEAAHVVDVVRPYLRAHPELTGEGITESKLVGALLSAHERLTNPKTAMQAFMEIGQQMGIDPDRLGQALGQDRGNDQSDISRHPQFQALQSELQRVSSLVNGSQAQQQQYQQQQRSRIVSQGVSEMETLREQRDQSGRYLYPKLHDDSFLHATKPLVAALAQSYPQLGYGELLKRAHDILSQGEGGQAQQPGGNAARLPQQRNFIPPSAPGVSVRGRSAPPSSGQEGDIPEEALKDAKSATEWAYKHLSAGGS